ncbi:cob(I)yrinic acid a,c-diamide adenosyltransferase [Guyparkeria hydrothermalis]|uniref:cob(I)yrinic acid a,c-diamide adenosyltransferase n=1 Tax=Guyparkeria hydrothermalis TaxID=923 RepID=UPI00202186E1|nr:cob(I)yrinic acid a,c-diamide adenosyltransferase [Guyparkeria hydrothermalis]MCL7744203.1 cob(I)yrinic acid a,c-diamide adenosyltransferase [Guyparkeria hydrothermalis]
MARSHDDRPRLSRVVTRSGDRGETGLADGRRLPKQDIAIELLGELDELNARLGLLAVSLDDEPQRLDFVREQQQAVFDLGGFVAMGEMAEPSQLPSIERLEAWIEAANADLPPLREFILPGGSEAMARAHLARTGTRRAERLAWAWCSADEGAALATYLNRLSDAWFVFARLLDPAGRHTVYWRGASSEDASD